MNHQGKTFITIIDDSHLMDMTTLRKLSLLFEDFPKNHNIILIIYLFETESLIQYYTVYVKWEIHNILKGAL